MSTNRLSRLVDSMNRLPRPFRGKALSFALGRTIRFVGTAGLAIVEIGPNMVHIRLDNRQRVQNHIGGIHAAAMALLAETATGLVVGMSVRDESIPVIKSLKVDYLKRATGGMEAVARLDDAAIESLQDLPKGDLLVPVEMTDDAGIVPVHCEMNWAWVSKRRSPKGTG